MLDLELKFWLCTREAVNVPYYHYIMIIRHH